jgi:hypothetical protein
MDASVLRQRLLEMQIEQIRDENFPSVEMMNRVENSLKTREQLEECAEILLAKVESTRFPPSAWEARSLPHSGAASGARATAHATFPCWRVPDLR